MRLIIATAALCVFATLIGWVLDRRRDFAIMKALGAPQKLVTSFFAAEACCFWEGQEPCLDLVWESALRYGLDG